MSADRPGPGLPLLRDDRARWQDVDYSGARCPLCAGVAGTNNARALGRGTARVFSRLGKVGWTLCIRSLDVTPDGKETHKLVSVVVPVYNEEEVLLQFHRRLAAALATVEMDVEIIYVNDGSADHTLPALHELRDADDRVAILHLSRNFGEEIAMTAGL
ncbi:MAG: glycosyltransferase [Acidiferrobacterales bacterium]